jgi:hypothetical protein
MCRSMKKREDVNTVATITESMHADAIIAVSLLYH